MLVTPLPSIHVPVDILDLSGSPVMLTAQTIKTLVQCQAKSIPHQCPQTPRHRDHLRRALAKQRVQEQLEPKAPEPEDGRAYTGVQTELCSDEPGDHGIKTEMVCQADVHLEQPPSLLCSLAEEGGAVARQAKGGERTFQDSKIPVL
ncbi:radial spoke head protein 3 homolog B-like isoform X2 [Athene cunicularia]|uniref:radial spoke head protein 3 homolog B-like isoform X2 n=1 Tax=Athene cunicularia TaxID=194338 RepID=UPI000EF73400|nr:radial spoke head protein 3 homolog B-like isoform X2 [Athene cunicularia]